MPAWCFILIINPRLFWQFNVNLQGKDINMGKKTQPLLLSLSRVSSALRGDPIGQGSSKALKHMLKFQTMRNPTDSKNVESVFFFLSFCNGKPSGFVMSSMHETSAYYLQAPKDSCEESEWTDGDLMCRATTDRIGAVKLAFHSGMWWWMRCNKKVIMTSLAPGLSF